MTAATIQRLRRDLEAWARHEGHHRFLHDDQTAQLEQALGDPSRRTQANVAAWLLGTWHLGQGMAQVLGGDVLGFDQARIGQALRRAALLARAHQTPPPRRGRAPRLPFSLVHGAWTALFGLALRDPRAEPLFALLLQLPDASFGERDWLPLFVRELLALRAGRRPMLSARLGPFQDVLQHWTGDAGLFARDLAAVCEWHLGAVRGAGAVLDDPACWLYPLVVFAIRDVRQWLDLPTPKVEHPLMHTNLGQMAPRTPWPDDEFVRRLERDDRGR